MFKKELTIVKEEASSPSKIIPNKNYGYLKEEGK